MTEAEWLAGDDPEPMIEHHCATATLRKTRLLGIACCRRLDDMLDNLDAKRALRVAELWAEGECGAVERKEARRVAQAVAELASRLSLEDGLTLSDSAAWIVQRLLQCGPLPLGGICYAAQMARLKDVGARAYLAKVPSELADERRNEVREAEKRAQCHLLRCIFGNPFRPVALDPRWGTETAVALASGIYTDRSFDRLPILADALEDAGCDAVELLAHLRGPGPHARGCWPLDLLLGRV